MHHITEPNIQHTSDLNKNKGGKKRIDPEIKQANQKAYIKQYKKEHRIWQAYTSDEIMQISDLLMKKLGFKSKQQLLEWLIERGRSHFARKGDKLDLSS
jgi:hypothetical protein